MSRSESVARPLLCAVRNLVLPAALLALGACGGNLDIPGVEKSIADGLAQQLGLAMTSVTCPPEPRAPRSGDRFQCTGQPAIGGSILVEVTQKDATGNIGWKVTKSTGLFDMQAAAAAVEQGLRDQMGAEVEVSCGDRWHLGSAGDFFECVGVAADGTTPTVVITVQDDAGNISWKLQ